MMQATLSNSSQFEVAIDISAILINHKGPVG